MNRRQFLQSVALAGAGTFALGPGAWAAEVAGAAPARRLIVVFLRGAVDGLNVVVPYTEANYYRLRPKIAIAKPGNPEGALDLDGRFGLHPALAPLLPLWRGGSLAFVPAAGSPDPTRSHFSAQDNIESGTPGNGATADGWLNRLEAALPTEPQFRTAPTRAISIGDVRPHILFGAGPVTTIASGAAAVRPSALDRPKVARAFAALYARDAKLGAAFQEYTAARGDVMEAMEAADSEMEAADNGAPPAYAFAGDAMRLATLMRRDPRSQLGFIAVSGWDTHANQGGAKGQLSDHLGRLAQGLVAMVQSLGPAVADTAIVVISEFGRTVAQNGNGGTDHGHGNAIWLLGGTIAGGKIHGQWPGLAEGSLYEKRDVLVTTDYRTVLAQICERHLRLPDSRLAAVFPAMPAQAAALELMKA